jgi:hypothetical protein
MMRLLASVQSGGGWRPHHPLPPRPPVPKGRQEDEYKQDRRAFVEQPDDDHGDRGPVAIYQIRLMHHAHVCQTAGGSIRLSQALAGKGVMPISS